MVDRKIMFVSLDAKPGTPGYAYQWSHIHKCVCVCVCVCALCDQIIKND